MTPVATRSRESGLSGRFSDAVLVLCRAFAKARRDGITTTAQALAYSLFLAIPSAFLVVLGGFLPGREPVGRQQPDPASTHRDSQEAATLLSDSLRRSTESPKSGLTMTIIGAALALWARTSAATTLMQGISATFDQPDRATFLRKRLVALMIVVCLVAAAALVSGLLVLGPYMQRWLGNAVGHPTITAWAWWTAQWPILVVGLLLAFAVLLYLGPAELEADHAGRDHSDDHLASGARGFALYASRFGSYDKAWGTLSAVVVMLISGYGSQAPRCSSGPK